MTVPLFRYEMREYILAILYHIYLCTFYLQSVKADFSEILS